MISPKQLKLIHVARKQLGLDEGTYRAVLADHGEVESASDLDFDGFMRVMACFNAMGFRSTWTERTYGEQIGMASPGQVDFIRKLWREWSDHADDTAGLNHCLENRFKISALRFLDPPAAHQAITALKAMTARKRKAAQGAPGVA